MKQKQTFEVGDKVTIKANLIPGKEYDGLHVATEMPTYGGKTATITELKINGDGDERYEIDIDSQSWSWNNAMLEAKKGRGRSSKPKPEDLTKYMIYATGCDNKSKLFETEKELKAEMKERTYDSDWTGRIMGYKLIPLFESKKTIKLLKLSKIKKVKAKKTIKKKPRRI